MFVALFLAGADVIAFTSDDIRREAARADCADGTSDSNAIIVCGVRRSNRYRIIEPQDFKPEGNRRSVSSERSRWGDGGDTGIGSCGPVGPGGWTGCAQQGWKRGRQQRGWFQ